MTKSTITRERLLAIADDNSWVKCTHDEVQALARIALAVMDSEPVAYMWDSERKDIDAPGFYRREHHFFAESNVKKWGGEVIPLYRHAQPAPVVPDGYVLVPREPTAEMIAAAMDCEDVLFNSDETFCVQFGNIYAAMIAAAPQEVTSARVHPARDDEAG